MSDQDVGYVDPVHEIYADGGVEIEEAGPCRRLIFCRGHHGRRVPVIAIILPATQMEQLRRMLAADALLAPDDIGKTMGSG